MRTGLTPSTVQWCRCGRFRGRNLADSVAVRRRFRAGVRVFCQTLASVRPKTGDLAATRRTRRVFSRRILRRVGIFSEKSSPSRAEMTASQDVGERQAASSRPTSRVGNLQYKPAAIMRPPNGFDGPDVIGVPNALFLGAAIAIPTGADCTPPPTTLPFARNPPHRRCAPGPSLDAPDY